MAIRNDLRAKLRASDKRRRRRARNVESPRGQQNQSADLDVTGLIVRALVDLAHRDAKFVDAGAVSALRGCVTGSAPASPQAQVAFAALQEIANGDSVHVRKFHVAAKDLLKIASDHRSREEPASFLTYLSIFST